MNTTKTQTTAIALRLKQLLIMKLVGQIGATEYEVQKRQLLQHYRELAGVEKSLALSTKVIS